jgi:hypothetical protein
MSRQTNDPSFLIFFIGFVAVIVFGFILLISKSIGADFISTGKAVVLSAIFLIVALVVLWFGKDSAWPSINLVCAVLMVCVWPTWWPVLDSIANGGNAIRTFESTEGAEGGLRLLPLTAFYAKWYFKWFIELLFLVWAFFAVLKGNFFSR